MSASKENKYVDAGMRLREGWMQNFTARKAIAELKQGMRLREGWMQNFTARKAIAELKQELDKLRDLITKGQQKIDTLVTLLDQQEKRISALERPLSDVISNGFLPPPPSAPAIPPETNEPIAPKGAMLSMLFGGSQ